MQLIYQTGIQHPTVVRNSGASTGIFAKMSRSGNEVIGRFRLSPAFVGPSLWAYFFVHYAQNKEEGPCTFCTLPRYGNFLTVNSICSIYMYIYTYTQSS